MDGSTHELHEIKCPMYINDFTVHVVACRIKNIELNNL